MNDPNRYCGFCGTRFGRRRAWPRQCAACGRKTYKNPLPVAVLLVPILDVDGLLAIHRTIEPGRGRLALPGGYVDWDDRTWQHAAARELREETGLRIRHADIREWRVLSSKKRELIVFALAPAIASSDVPDSTPSDEVSECVVLCRPQRLAFSSHTQVVQAYFDCRPTVELRRPVRT